MKNKIKSNEKQPELNIKEKVLDYLNRAKVNEDRKYDTFRKMVGLAYNKVDTLTNTYNTPDKNLLDRLFADIYNMEKNTSYLDGIILSNDYRFYSSAYDIIGSNFQFPIMDNAIIDRHIDSITRYIDHNFSKLCDVNSYIGADDEGYDRSDWFINDELILMIANSTDETMHITICRIIRLLVTIEYFNRPIEIYGESCSNVVSFVELLPYMLYVIGKDPSSKTHPVIVNMLKLNCIVSNTVYNCGQIGPISHGYGYNMEACMSDKTTSLQQIVLQNFFKYNDNTKVVDSVYHYIQYITCIIATKSCDNTHTIRTHNKFKPKPHRVPELNMFNSMDKITEDVINKLYYYHDEHRQLNYNLSCDGYTKGSSLGYFLTHVLILASGTRVESETLLDMKNNKTISDIIIPLSYMITRQPCYMVISNIYNKVLSFVRMNDTKYRSFGDFLISLVESNLPDTDIMYLNRLVTLVGTNRVLELLDSGNNKLNSGPSFDTLSLVYKPEVFNKYYNVLSNDRTICGWNINLNNTTTLTKIGVISKFLSELCCIECVNICIDVIIEVESNIMHTIAKPPLLKTYERLQKVSPYQINEIFSLSKSNDAFKHYFKNKLR